MAVESGNASSILGVIIGGVVVVALGFFLFGGFGWSGGKSVDVSVKAPNISSAK
jgi:hypothetical protein